MSTDLEAEHEQLLQFIYASPIGLVEVTQGGDISMINPHAMQLLLPIARTAVVTNFFAIMETCAPEIRNMADAFPEQQGLVCLNHRIFVRPSAQNGGDGIKVLACTVVKVHSKHLMVTIADITEQINNEDTMSRAKEGAEAANRAKSEFLANMSHEIRTPLNGVIGMTDVALDSQPGKQQREYLETIKLSANALLTVISDILDFSKIEAGRMNLEAIDFNLRNCMEEALRCVSVSAYEHGIELLCDIAADIPEMVRGDPSRLRQVVINLIGNAIKFTLVGEVSLIVQIHDGGSGPKELQVTVSDTGIGIPSNKQQVIFDAFVQADTTTTRVYGGTGLGLSICARLVSMMGGRIGLHSEVGHGSTFHFTVPLECPAIKTTPSENMSLKLLGGLKLLIVDDNASNRSILETMLTCAGLRTHAVAGGEQALLELLSSKADADPYRVVLTDSHMPNMDGFRLIEEIRNNSQLCTPSIIMLSSIVNGEVKRCGETTSYLLKPVRKLELLATIAKVVDGCSADVPSAPPSELVRSLIGLKILLAEDNRINQIIAARTLQKMGHSVVIAGNGCEAIALMAKNTFDLILMDIQMPQMDGLTATSRIREAEVQSSAHIPIIALTAHAMEGDRERYLEGGMDGYVSKPINRSELEKSIASLVKG